MPKQAPIVPELLADLCLAHLAGEAQLLADFMVVTGYTSAGLKGALGSDGLNRGLIDYFAQHEPLLVALCAGNGLKPEDFMRVWSRLNPGG